ncbi:MAG: hypothetical protein ACE5HA_02485 [Anaerolineae bacterium]
MKTRARMVVAGAAAMAGYGLAIRPWHLRWGATDTEVNQPQPGDDLIPHPSTESTRSITINASATAIWPWLVQMGQGRGGLYSYDWIENLLGLDIHSADRIIPELQDLKVGDIVRFAPEGGPGMCVAAIEPNRALVLTAMDLSTRRPVDRTNPTYLNFTWSFILSEIDEQTTRLTIRGRGDARPRFLAVLYLLLEPAQFVMERKMLLGIKQRAEEPI